MVELSMVGKLVAGQVELMEFEKAVVLVELWVQQVVVRKVEKLVVNW